MNELIETIIEEEWKLFHSVNDEKRVCCQNDRKTFEIMRRAQYSAWSLAALTLYSEDLRAAIDAGRNPVREKYIYMMRSTAPDEYEYFTGELPSVSDAKSELVTELWSHFAAQTERLRANYPLVALGGRPLYAKDETSGWPSVETYQISELLTYSETTLRALLDHIVTLENRGIDFARLVQENTVKGLGFADLDAAENAIKKSIK